MKTAFLSVATATALSLLLCGAANAQKMSSGAPSSLFQDIDANRDKVVTRAEYMDYRNSHFKAKPGMNRAQYDQQSADLFARRDRNKDGQLTANEFQQLPPKRN